MVTPNFSERRQIESHIKAPLNSDMPRILPGMYPEDQYASPQQLPLEGIGLSQEEIESISKALQDGSP